MAADSSTTQTATESLSTDPKNNGARQSGITVSPSWIDLNRAHAYLFLGRFDEAKAIYLKHKGNKQLLDDIKDDFALIQKLKLATPEIERDMDRIIQLIGV